MGTITSFEQFYKENYARFFYQAFSLVEDEEVCRDIVGDCFEHVWLNHRNDGVNNWTAYMSAFVKNRCIDYLRRRLVQEKYIDFCLQTEPESMEEYNEEEEQIAIAHRMLEKLPPQTRHILEECYLQKKKYKEVAEELGISASTVKKHIIKALKELRQQMVKK